MAIRVLVMGLAVLAMTACGKSVVGTETGNPPVIAPERVTIESAGGGLVVVAGPVGTVVPGGGELVIRNDSQGGVQVIVAVAQDGSFRGEVMGSPDDDYTLVASNGDGSSDPQVITPDGPPVATGWQTLHACRPSDPMHAIDVFSARVDGDRLEVEVGHGGGCESHDYGICYEEGWTEGTPIGVPLRLLHDSHGDMCDAYFMDTLTFDLTPFQAAYEQAYRVPEGEAAMGFPCSDEESGACGFVYRWHAPTGDAAPKQNSQACGPPIAGACPQLELPAPVQDWVVYDTGCNFSYRAPEGLVDTDARGIDSCVHILEDADCAFDAGSGAFSGAFNELAELSDYVVGQATIDGLQAKIVVASTTGMEPRFGTRAYRFLAAAHFPEPFPANPGATIDLMISCADRETRDAMLAVLGTVTIIE